jgi:predicted ATPase/Tfp pilus assembly protein PilF
MTKIRELLRGTRLLTLTGAGGVGKTRLAMQAAAEELYEYPDGVWLVDLAALSDVDLVPQSLASALGVREEAGRPLADTLVAHLRDKQSLLLLDNCEHLVGACAGFVESLTRRCAGLTMLATSREVLRAEGETVWRVPSLSVPHPQPGVRLEPQQLTEYAAVRLFVDRATKANPSFMVTSGNAPAVAEVCARLDGIPLAIELSAARSSILSVEEIEKRLDERFRLLIGGRRTALPRQQTLEATVRWSYELLPESERALFARLSVFAGGFTLESAQVVCSGGVVEGDSIPDLLTELAAKSLVIPGAGRYWMLETLREYGSRRLTECGQADAVRRRHAAYYADRAVEIHPLLWSPKAETWLAWCETEQADFRSALRWAVQHDANLGLRLAGSLTRVWGLAPHWTEGRGWLARLLASEEVAELPLRANGLFWAGGLALQQGDYVAALGLLRQAAELHRELGDRRGEARDLLELGNTATFQGDYRAARIAFEQSLSMFEECESTPDIARSLHALGWVAHEQREVETARTYYARALGLYRQEGDTRSVVIVLNNLGNLADDDGDCEAAVSFHEEGLALSREIGDRAGVSHILSSMGYAAGVHGDHAKALALCEEALTIARELDAKREVVLSLLGTAGALTHLGRHEAAGDQYREALTSAVKTGAKPLVSYCLEGLAELAYERGQFGRAALLFGATLGLRRSIDLPQPGPGSPGSHEEQARATRDGLGEEAFAAAWAEGEAMTLEEAVAFALEEGADG